MSTRDRIVFDRVPARSRYARPLAFLYVDDGGPIPRLSRRRQKQSWMRVALRKRVQGRRL